MWTKDGGELPDLERMIVEGKELIFTSLNKTDNGTYRCEASNHLGTSSAEYVLYVYGEFRRRPAVGAIILPAITQEGTERNLNHSIPPTVEGPEKVKKKRHPAVLCKDSGG